MTPNGKKFSDLQAIGDHETEGLIIFDDTKNVVVYHNKQAHSITGLTANTPVDLTAFLKKIIPQDRDYVKAKYILLCNEGSVTDVEFSIETPEGPTIPVRCNAHLIADNTCIVLFIKNISWLRRHEDYLIEYGAKKNTILDTLAHNVNGALQLMQHLSVEAERSVALEDFENLKVYLTLLQENNKHCVDIIADLLKKENIETLQISVRASRMDVVAKVRFVYENLVETYKHRNFAYTYSRSEIFLNADEFKLLQVVINLVSNAVKFTEDTKQISINIWEDEKEVICSVADQGIGIPEALQPFVFDRKSIAGRPGLRGEKSIGIGLSVSRRLVELMNGRIWFESRENVGTTFYIALLKDGF